MHSRRRQSLEKIRSQCLCHEVTQVEVSTDVLGMEESGRNVLPEEMVVPVNVSSMPCVASMLESSLTDGTLVVTEKGDRCLDLVLADNVHQQVVGLQDHECCKSHAKVL